MFSNKFKFQIKITSLIFIVVCLYGSCASVDSSQISLNKSTDNASRTKVANVEYDDASNKILVDNSNTNSNSNAFSEEKIKRSRQTVPRRRKINFPNDCQQVARTGNEYLLEAVCADALYDVQPDLPKTHIIGVASSGSSADAPQSDCDYAVKQNFEGHFNFDEYGAKFYSLSTNKYLAEVRCAEGAYNQINAYLLYDESAIPAKAQVLEFESFRFTHDEDSDVAKTIDKVTVKTVGGVYFNQKTKELIVFVKAHGIGDAGHFARYSFPNGKPKLEEFRAKFKWEGHGYGTDEILKNPPRTWKKYYPQ